MLLLSALLPLLAGLVSASPLTDASVQKRQVDANYVFATFQAQNENSDSETTQLNIYTSEDGLHYEEYAMDTYQPASGLVRDPSIIHYLGKYYVAHTTGWTSRDIGIISSSDLKSWEPVTTITMPDWAEKAWAPASSWESEFFWDPANGSLNIIVSLHSSESGSIWEPYITSAKQGEIAKNWNEPQLLGLIPNKKNEGHIDMFVVYNEQDSDRPYHAIVKNEAAKHLEHWKAGSVDGPYDWVDGVHLGTREGPAVTRVMDDGTEKWLMLCDDYHGTMFYAMSEDLENWGWGHPLPDLASEVRHGTIIRQ